MVELIRGQVRDLQQSPLPGLAEEHGQEVAGGKVVEELEERKRRNINLPLVTLVQATMITLARLIMELGELAIQTQKMKKL